MEELGSEEINYERELKDKISNGESTVRAEVVVKDEMASNKEEDEDSNKLGFSIEDTGPNTPQQESASSITRVYRLPSHRTL